MIAQTSAKTEELHTWEDFSVWCNRIFSKEVGQKRKWMFRGMRSSCYDLSTRLERLAYAYDIPLDELPNLERNLIREFMRRAHNYISQLPAECDRVGWLSLMQHYGAPTRLLDWTYSPYVAAFFALEGTTTQDACAIWAFDFAGCRVDDTIIRLPSTSQDDCKNRMSAMAAIPDPVSNKVRQAALVNHLFDHPMATVVVVNPFRLNERLTIQQGVMLMPGDITKPFADNFVGSCVQDRDMDKVTIPNDGGIRIEFLHNLHRMNISAATLFPGLQGFAQSLQSRILFPETLGGWPSVGAQHLAEADAAGWGLDALS